MYNKDPFVHRLDISTASMSLSLVEDIDSCNAESK